MGNELFYFQEELKQTIGKLKELETSSHFNHKIGLKAIKDSLKNLAVLEDDVERQISSLENNFQTN